MKGFDCVFGGDVPLGAGMSSSTSIVVGLSYAINDIFKYGYTNSELVEITHRVEIEYRGLNGGIMDMFTILNGLPNKVIKLDCRSKEFEHYPLDMSDYLIVLINTGVSHNLASSEYNKRRKTCEKGVEFLKQFDRSIKSLRDVSLELLEKHKNEMDPIVFKRC